MVLHDVIANIDKKECLFVPLFLFSRFADVILVLAPLAAKFTPFPACGKGILQLRDVCPFFMARYSMRKTPGRKTQDNCQCHQKATHRKPDTPKGVSTVYPGQGTKMRHTQKMEVRIWSTAVVEKRFKKSGEKVN